VDFFCFVVYNVNMQKKLVIFTGLFLVLVLSGCTFGGAGSSTSAPVASQKYTLSESIWISHDAGKKWEASATATNKPSVTDINPLSLVFDSNDANVAYAGLRAGGIIKTKDGGVSWEFLPFKTEKVYGLALDPRDTKIIYVSTVFNGRGKMAKSLDGGATWNEIYTVATNGPLVVYLVTDKKNAGTIYASTSDNQIIKSTDGGTAWKNVFEASSPVIKISLDAVDSRLVYLLTKNGEIYFSRNAGDTFESLTQKITLTGMLGSGFSVMETDPVKANWLYLAGRGGIIRTKDAGDSWEKIIALNNPENSPIGALAINPKNSNELIYGALQATYASIDGGKTWTTAQFDLEKVINNLKYNPVSPQTIFASFLGK
jgi:photosystem II stability/assembly factor-like uncharacterized protein